MALSIFLDLPDVRVFAVGYLGRLFRGCGPEDLSKAPYLTWNFSGVFYPTLLCKRSIRLGMVVVAPNDIGTSTLLRRTGT
jgi:hypothetical protein